VDAGEFYGGLSSEYDQHFSDPLSLMENRLVFERLGTVRGTILDIGCGTGLALEYLRLDGRYIGIDISPAMIERASAKFGWAMKNGTPDHQPRVMFHVAPMEEMTPIASDSINLALSLFGSFSYSKNPRATVREIFRVLKPDGRALVMVYSNAHRLIRGPISAGRVVSRHYSVESLERLFSDFVRLEVTGICLLTRRIPFAIGNLIPGLMGVFERRLADRWPDYCRYLSISARKPVISRGNLIS
jgi:SAM-dependent methyltransferase